MQFNVAGMDPAHLNARSTYSRKSGSQATIQPSESNYDRFSQAESGKRTTHKANDSVYNKTKGFLTKVREDGTRNTKSSHFFNSHKDSEPVTVDNNLGTRVDRNVKNDSQLIFSPAACRLKMQKGTKDQYQNLKSNYDRESTVSGSTAVETKSHILMKTRAAKDRTANKSSVAAVPKQTRFRNTIETEQSSNAASRRPSSAMVQTG